MQGLGIKRSLTIYALAALLGGCAASPEITTLLATSYGDVVAHEGKLVTAYHLQASRLSISFRPTGTPPRVLLVVTSQPVEDTRHRFLLLAHRSLFARTTLTVARRDNTDLIKTIGSEVTDNRIALIQNLGAIVKVAVTGTVSGREFDAEWSLETPGAFRPVPSLTPGWSRWRYDEKTINNLEIELGPPPVTAVPNSESLFGRRRTGLFVSACRPAIVRYTTAEGAEHAWRGKVADPEFLELVTLPAKGKVEFHSECGASVTTDKDPTVTTDALLAAAAAQAVAVAEAYKAAAK